MKKDNRNYAMNVAYPVYPMPMQQPMMPGMGMQQAMMPGMVMQPQMNASCGNDSSLKEQVANLEKRVARLEGMMQSAGPSYTESNFYMV